MTSVSPTGSPSKRSTARRLRPVARACWTRAVRAVRSQPSSGSAAARGAPAALDEERSLAADRERHAPATRAARAPERFGHESAARRGCAGSAAARTAWSPPPASRGAARPRRGGRTARRRGPRRSIRGGRRRASRACAARGRPARSRRDPLGPDAVARDDPVPLEEGSASARGSGSPGKPGGRRPAPLRGRDGVRPGPREPSRRFCGRAAWKAAARAQRLPGVVRRLTRPDEIPERRQCGLALEAGRGQEVVPEARRRRAPRIASCASPSGGGSAPGLPSAAASSRVQRPPLGLGAHPDDLPGGGELVEPGRLVAGDLARAGRPPQSATGSESP